MCWLIWLCSLEMLLVWLFSCSFMMVMLNIFVLLLG